MTFLELLQAFHREYGLSGDSPTSAENQTGETLRLVHWLIDAYKDIQNAEQWRWLRVTFTCTTTADQDSYAFGECNDTLDSAAITRFKRWRIDDLLDPPKIYLSSSGVGTQTWMSYVPWDWFKSVYRIGTRNSAFPFFITADPQNKLVVGPPPGDEYVITGDYVRSAQVLALDEDVPEMPEDFHMLIVHRAAKKYAYYESANEVLSRANEDADRLYRQLQADQLPTFRMAGALA